MRDIRGQVALVTGASRGIGRAIAIALAQAGCHVALMARNLEQLHQTASLCEAHGAKTMTLAIDITDRYALQQGIDTIAQSFGALHILVNNAGIIDRSSAFEASIDAWERVIDVNLRSAMYATRFALPHIQKQEEGTILFISSIAGKMTAGTVSSYSATKHGIVGFAGSLFEDIREHNIKVCTICPGFVHTDMVEHTELVFERMLQPDDVAQTALFVAQFPHTGCPTEIILRPQRTPYPTADSTSTQTQSKQQNVENHSEDATGNTPSAAKIASSTTLDPVPNDKEISPILEDSPKEPIQEEGSSEASIALESTQPNEHEEHDTKKELEAQATEEVEEAQEPEVPESKQDNAESLTPVETKAIDTRASATDKTHSVEVKVDSSTDTSTHLGSEQTQTNEATEPEVQTEIEATKASEEMKEVETAPHTPVGSEKKLEQSVQSEEASIEEGPQALSTEQDALEATTSVRQTDTQEKESSESSEASREQSAVSTTERVVDESSKNEEIEESKPKEKSLDTQEASGQQEAKGSDKVTEQKTSTEDEKVAQATHSNEDNKESVVSVTSDDSAREQERSTVEEVEKEDTSADDKSSEQNVLKTEKPTSQKEVGASEAKPSTEDFEIEINMDGFAEQSIQSAPTSNSAEEPVKVQSSEEYVEQNTKSESEIDSETSPSNIQPESASLQSPDTSNIVPDEKINRQDTVLTKEQLNQTASLGSQHDAMGLSSRIVNDTQHSPSSENTRPEKTEIYSKTDTSLGKQNTQENVNSTSQSSLQAQPTVHSQPNGNPPPFPSLTGNSVNSSMNAILDSLPTMGLPEGGLPPLTGGAPGVFAPLPPLNATGSATGLPSLLPPSPSNPALTAALSPSMQSIPASTIGSQTHLPATENQTNHTIAKDPVAVSNPSVDVSSTSHTSSPYASNESIETSDPTEEKIDSTVHIRRPPEDQRALVRTLPTIQEDTDLVFEEMVQSLEMDEFAVMEVLGTAKKMFWAPLRNTTLQVANENIVAFLHTLDLSLIRGAILEMGRTLSTDISSVYHSHLSNLESSGSLTSDERVLYDLNPSQQERILSDIRSPFREYVERLEQLDQAKEMLLHLLHEHISAQLGRLPPLLDSALKVRLDAMEEAQGIEQSWKALLEVMRAGLSYYKEEAQEEVEHLLDAMEQFLSQFEPTYTALLNRIIEVWSDRLMPPLQAIGHQ